MGEIVQFPVDEDGQASILITLDNSTVTVVHASKGVILLQGKVKKGWWRNLISVLETDLERILYKEDFE